MSSDRQPKKRKNRQQPSRRHLPTYRGMTAELSLKLIFSWVVAIASVTSLVKLIPYHLSQQAKLKELKIQVAETDARVAKLREQLNRNVDPQQTQSLMEQYGSLISPHRQRIYWLPEAKVEE